MSRVVLDRDRSRGGAAAGKCEATGFTGVARPVIRRVGAVFDVARVARASRREATLKITKCASATSA